MAEEGGSKAGPPLAPELDISIHFDLGALGDVLISARQDDSVVALATVERVTAEADPKRKHKNQPHLAWTGAGNA